MLQVLIQLNRIKGVFIGALSIIGPHAQIGNYVLINTHAGIGHHSVIADYSQICPKK